MAPGYLRRWPSSQFTLSASRWLVGSSSSSKSGWPSSSLHSATRRRSPPESLVTSASSAGQRSASLARSTWLSTSAGELELDAFHGAQHRAVGGAVDAEHADLGVRVERQVDVIQQRLGRRVGLGQTLHVIDELATVH